MSGGAVVVITRDLMDASRVRSVIGDVVVVRGLDDPAIGSAAVVLLDLATTLAPADAVAIGPPVIAYGAHVDVAALEAARVAGCVDALPRSQVFRRLAEVVEPYR